MTNATTRTRLLGVGLLTAVFFAGGLAGAAVFQVRGVSADGAPPAAEDRGEERPDRRCRVPFGYLELTAEQRARVDAAFERRRHQLDAFWKDNGPRYESIVDSTRAEFRSVLTAEQLSEYDRRRAEHQQREEREREKRRQREQECEQLREQQNGETSR